MINLVWLVPLFPLIGFVIIGLGRNILPKAVAGILGSLAVFLSFGVSIAVFMELQDVASKTHLVYLFDWIK